MPKSRISSVLDAMLITSDAGRLLLEVKTSKTFRLVTYFDQIQHNMLVSGTTQCILLFFPTNNDNHKVELNKIQAHLIDASTNWRTDYLTKAEVLYATFLKWLHQHPVDEHAGKLVLDLVFAKSPPTAPKTPDGKADPDRSVMQGSSGVGRPKRKQAIVTEAVKRQRANCALSTVDEQESSPDAAALELWRAVDTGLLCEVCKKEVFDEDTCLECTSLSPACDRQYHAACVKKQFGHLYSTLIIPQPFESTWRCMVCSDMCATCVPAAKILPGQALKFFTCGYCGARAHQSQFHCIEDVYKKRIMHVNITIIANCPDDTLITNKLWL
jgi:hypothetical protein